MGIRNRNGDRMHPCPTPAFTFNWSVVFPSCRTQQVSPLYVVLFIKMNFSGIPYCLIHMVSQSRGLGYEPCTSWSRGLGTNSVPPGHKAWGTNPVHPGHEATYSLLTLYWWGALVPVQFAYSILVGCISSNTAGLLYTGGVH